MSLVIFLVATSVIAGLSACSWRRLRAICVHHTEPPARRPRPIAVPTIARKPGCMINAAPGCCRLARNIESAWYAQDQVPRLPLESCETPARCHCTWMRVLDRRATRQRTDG